MSENYYLAYKGPLFHGQKISKSFVNLCATYSLFYQPTMLKIPVTFGASEYSTHYITFATHILESPLQVATHLI